MSSKGQELLPLVTIVSWRRKINKKHWLKRPTKHSPKRQNLDQNINDSKSHNLEFFFWKYFFGHNIFLYLSSRKDHTFYNTVSLKKTSFCEPQLTWHWLQILQQTCFCLVSEKIFALQHFLAPNDCIFEALWKQMSVYFFISP